MICEPSNHTVAGICTATSIVNINNLESQENRKIVVRILNTTPIPQTIKKHTPLVNLVDVDRLDRDGKTDSLNSSVIRKVNNVSPSSGHSVHFGNVM